MNTQENIETQLEESPEIYYSKKDKSLFFIIRNIGSFTDIMIEKLKAMKKLIEEKTEGKYGDIYSFEILHSQRYKSYWLFKTKTEVIPKGAFITEDSIAEFID